MKAYPFNTSADDSGFINESHTKTIRHCGQTKCNPHPTSILPCTAHTFAYNASQSHNRNDNAIACQARNDGESDKKHKTSPAFLSAQSSLRTAPSPKLGEGRGEVKKAAFTLAEVFHPAEQSRRIAFTLAEVFHPAEQSRRIAFTLAEVFHPAEQSRRITFTLAEVLITLGIIGVVAALTMPSLIANHRKHEVETKLAKFYSVMNQAVKLAEIDYGDKKYWEKYEVKYEIDEEGNKKKIPNFAFFNKYFAPYLKLVKVDSLLSRETIVLLAYFADGSLATFDAEAIHYYINKKDIKIKNDIPLIGKRIFTFYFNPNSGNGVEPYKNSWDGDINTLRTHPSLGCKEDATIEPAYCTALIQLNGWKIPDDYPIKF